MEGEGISPGELVKLRDDIASQFGEDIAQDMVIRALERPWLTPQNVVRKAKWRWLSTLRIFNKRVSWNQESMDTQLSYNGTDRIMAYIDLKREVNSGFAAAYLALIEMGLVVRNKFVEARLRKAVKSRKGKQS